MNLATNRATNRTTAWGLRIELRAYELGYESNLLPQVCKSSFGLLYPEQRIELQPVNRAVNILYSRATVAIMDEITGPNDVRYSMARRP